MAKETVFFLYLYCGYVPLRDLLLSVLGRSRAVVLYYHKVGESNILSKSVAQFRDDLGYLAKRYECLTFAALCNRLNSGRRCRRRIAVVTFDDGYLDNRVNAVPILLEFGVPASFFVSTGFVGTCKEFPHDRLLFGPDSKYPKLNWSDLLAMQDAGFDIGSHTVNHADMSAVDETTAVAELKVSLDALTRELGNRTRCFTFPWGRPKEPSDRLLRELAQCGYRGAAGASGGTNTVGANPFLIRRVDLGNGGLTSLASRARIAGLDPAFWQSIAWRLGVR